MTVDCTYPDGLSTDLSRAYFERGGTVVTRQALPHPLAVRIDGRPLDFTPTVDANLLQCFGQDEIHYVADPDELAVVKLSPPGIDYRKSQRTIRQRVRAKQLLVTDPLQRWFLSQQVLLVGERRECGDAEYVEVALR